jgi:DNA replication protein DnaC
LTLSNTFLKASAKRFTTELATFESFKGKVLQIRKKVEEFKDNHKMASQAISVAIDSMPEPFNKFFSVIWNGLEREGEDGTAKLLEILKRIEGTEQSFDEVKASISQLIQYGARTEDIQKLGEQIRISNESFINSLKRDINQKLGSTDLKQLNIDEIERYYNVRDASRILNIQQSYFDMIKKWLELWDKANKPILVITGDPGVGKSWLSYELVSHFEDKGHKVYGVIGADIKRHVLLADNEVDKQKENEKFPFYILDDRGISVGEASRSITVSDINKILHSFLPTGFQLNYKGPLIISIREETWNRILRGDVDIGKPLTKSALGEVVYEIKLKPVEPRETEKLARSFYEEVDGKIPLYPNLSVDDDVRKIVAEKCKGNPLVIESFFYRMHSKSKGSSYSVTMQDTQGVISSPQYYCLKLIYDYYLSNQNDSEKIIHILSFLYLLAKEGSISIGHLKRLQKNRGLLPDDIWGYLDLKSDTRPVPFFNMDELGIISPFHDSVSNAIVSLVEKPQMVQKNIRTELSEDEAKSSKELLKKLDEIAAIDIDIGSEDNYISGIKEKAETELIKKYDDSIIESVEYYFKRWNKEMQHYHVVLADSTYSFLSVLIEILHSRTTFIDRLIVNRWARYRDKFIQTLQNVTFDYGEIRDIITNQLYWLFQEWNISDHGDEMKSLTKYCLDFLSSSNIDVKSKAWSDPYALNVVKLLQWGIVNIDEVRERIQHYFELLNHSDQGIKSKAWRWIRQLIYQDVLTREDEDRILAFLCDAEKETRSLAWSCASQLVDYHVINIERMREPRIRNVYLQLLTDTDEKTKLNAWNKVYSFLKRNIFTPEDLQPLKGHYFKLLCSSDKEIRDSSWYILLDLLDPDRGFVTHKDNENFINLFNHAEEQVRILAWKNARILATGFEEYSGEGVKMKKTGVISIEQLRINKQYLLGLLKSTDRETRDASWSIDFEYLLDSKVLTDDDIVKLKECFPNP